MSRAPAGSADHNVRARSQASKPPLSSQKNQKRPLEARVLDRVSASTTELGRVRLLGLLDRTVVLAVAPSTRLPRAARGGQTKGRVALHPWVGRSRELGRRRGRWLLPPGSAGGVSIFDKTKCSPSVTQHCVHPGLVSYLQSA